MTEPKAPARRLLVTDLDGTLVGDAEGLARLKATLAGFRDQWGLVYATGRTMTQARRLAREEDLPEPDIWITEVGAAITYPGGRTDEEWAARMAEHWDRALVERTVMAIPAMSRQPEDAMGRFKLSFRIAPDAAKIVLPALGQALRDQGVPVLLIYSSQRDLDVVPATAGKAAAVRHVMKDLGLTSADVLTAGDSANDHDMLCHGGPAVAVGNALPELIEAGLPPTVLRARARCADGILEALGHYGWLPELPAGAGSR